MYSNALLSIKGKGNIGLLKNIIISSCANSYRNKLDDDILHINTQDIANNFKNVIKVEKNVYHENLHIIRKEEKYKKVIMKNIDENPIIEESLKNIHQIINMANKCEMDDEKFKKLTTLNMNKILNDVAFNKTKIQSDIITYEFTEKSGKFRNVNCRTWNMARKLKILEKEKYPLDDLKNDEIFHLFQIGRAHV